MSVKMLIGVILILAAAVDCLVGVFLVLPRVPEESRNVLRGALLAGAGLMFALGAAFLTGIL